MARCAFAWIVLFCFLALPQTFLLGQEAPPAPPAVAPLPDPQEVTVFDWAVNPELFRKLWEGSLELGLNGASGNSDNYKMRVATTAKRETPNRIFLLDFVYNFASQNGVDSENRSMTKVRQEWLRCGSPWSVFLSGSGETDQFKAFDVRLAAHVGVGYAFINNDWTKFKGRAGFGASREIGGPDSEVKPELLFGFDFSHKLTDRQKIGSTFDFFPNVSNFSDFRTELKAFYEILIDPTWNMTLKIGLCDRYDNTPEGRRRNDLEYFAVVMWKF